MIVGFADNAWEDCLYWQNNDKKILKRIKTLLKDIKRDPDSKEGLGKPERLKVNLSGYYSRRITSEQRLVYKILDGMIIIAQCRHHY